MGPEVAQVSDARRHPDRSPAVAGGAGDDLGLGMEEWEAVSSRLISPAQWQRFEGFMGEIFGDAAPVPAGDLRCDQRV